MPQMSPLAWVVLMFFFIIFYLVLSVGVYYELYVGSFNLEGGGVFVKYDIKFSLGDK